jgi:hypothetical protein
MRGTSLNLDARMDGGGALCDTPKERRAER